MRRCVREAEMVSPRSERGRPDAISRRTVRAGQIIPARGTPWKPRLHMEGSWPSWSEISAPVSREGILSGTLPAGAGTRLAYTLRASRANNNGARESLATRGAACEDTLPPSLSGIS